ncbi:hypothetical protein EV132_1653 [Rhizobium sullae]|uniref:Uncharacterized protein n=1 Tax=Rhizobium sullae TaxID=50338 RepID=A0A4R3PPV2_RHISU|nr:hypothetical protein EV132_1653 [Rhizobium sullae]
MTNPNYRSQAKQLVKEARAELEAGGDERLSYAALKLRFAMEAITIQCRQGSNRRLHS